MGNGHSLPMAGQEAQEELRAIQPEMIPTTQSDVVRATEEAEEPKARELAISAQLFHINPRMIEFSMIEAVVRRGYVDKIRILFDAEVYTDFIPKITRVLSYSDKVHTLEMFADQMPRKPILPFFSYPNVIDNLPARMPALSGFHLATTPSHESVEEVLQIAFAHYPPHLNRTVHWDVIAKVMVRARGLKALKIEGPQIVWVQPWVDYIGCNLKCLILRYVNLNMDILREILGRSGESLRILHIEHVTSLDRELLAQLIGTCVPGLQQLTVIIPDTVALERNNLELAGIMDSAMAAPLLSVQYMYCAGLCISDWSFLREKNAHAALATVVPSLQKLILHTCRRVKPGGLTLAIAQNRLPKLAYLEALWPMSDSKVEDMAMLYHVCSERSIMLSPAMTDYYRELNANLVLEEGLQDSRRWTDKAINEERKSGHHSSHRHHDESGSNYTSRSKRHKKHRKHGHRRDADVSDADTDETGYRSTKSHTSRRSRHTTHSRVAEKEKGA